MFSSQRGKDYVLVGVPFSWIDAAPKGTLIIDPTVQPVSNADVYLYDASNHNSAPDGLSLLVGKFAGTNKKRTIIKFPMTSIPANATVLNAQMKLRYFGNGGSTWVDRWVQAHRVLVDWNETQATRDARLTSPSYTAWKATYGKIGPGNNPSNEDADGQYESRVLFWQNETLSTWKSWDLTALTQKWVNGSASNYGVILWATNEDTDGKDLQFRSTSYTAGERPFLEVIYSQYAKTVYFLKDHLGSIRATVWDTLNAPVVGHDDYDPWGYILAGRSLANAVLPVATRNRFTGKERDDDFGINWDYFGARYYDAQIGRWMSVDPLAGKYPAWSPYVYSVSDPINKYDPDGRAVNFLVGAAIGALTDVALQVAMNYYEGRALTNIDLGGVAVSAAAGSIGVGLAGKISSLGTLARLGVEVALDGGASVLHQAVTTGEIDPKAVAIDVLGWQVAGKIAGDVAGKIAQNTPEAKVLTQEADRKQRIADNSSSSRKDAKEAQAKEAKEKLNSYKAERAASASVAASGTASTVAEKALEKDDNDKKPN